MKVEGNTSIFSLFKIHRFIGGKTMAEVRNLLIDADGVLRIPRGTTLPVAGMVEGDLFWKTDTDVLYVYGDAVWVASNVDTTAIHKATSGEISAMTEKTAPLDADLVVIESAADTNAKRKVQLSNLAGMNCKIFSPSEVVYSTSTGGAVALTLDGTTRVYLHGTRSSGTPTITVYVYGKIPCDFKSFSTTPVAIGVTQRRVGTITTSITLYKNGVADSTINGVSLAPGTSFAEATFQPGSTFVPGDEYLIVMTASLGSGLEYDWANLRMTVNRKVG
jgi:hypothetical protein